MSSRCRLDRGRQSRAGCQWQTCTPVNRLGSGPVDPSCVDGTGDCFQLNPMVWHLAPGPHSVVLYGRESFVEIDQVAIRMCPSSGCAALAEEGCPAKDGGL